jgi:RNA polymerase sigma-70 factor (ECF subfamily)
MAEDPTRDERCLIANAQAGDERAFRELVEPYRRALEVHAYRMLGTPHDAEDIVQETLMRAWRTLDRFERRSSIETWLYRIATNACLDELERRPRRPVPVDPYPNDRLEQAETAIVDPAARYAIREGVELAFLTAIQRLPGRQRAIIILRDVLGWTAPEVAELLESTVAGVNSALQRARATIDAELPASSRTAAAPSDRRLLADYVDAWESADVDRLIGLLRADALLRMPPGRAILGRYGIGEFFGAGPCGGKLETIRLVPTRANGLPAVAMYKGGDDGKRRPHGVLVLEFDGDHVATIDAFIDERLPGLFATS